MVTDIYMMLYLFVNFDISEIFSKIIIIIANKWENIFICYKRFR